MANPEQLAKLKEGVEAWNEWRNVNPDIKIDLREADLREMDLWSVKFNGAKLTRTNLTKANLNLADLREADLVDAVLEEALLAEANLFRADLRGANLHNAEIGWASLFCANLTGANLHKAYLKRADLSEAKLRDANLSEADLTSACLQFTTLDGATLTKTRLWGTQRERWSIKGIRCEFAYWDEAGEKPDHYATGEFERLYSHQTRIELLYPGGMTTFELNTLPALLHHLSLKYPNSGIRLKSMEEAGGGAKISISVLDTTSKTVDEIREEATRSQSAQIALRDNEIERLRIQKQLLLDEVFPRMLAAAPQVHFAGDATNVAIALGGSTVTAHQTHNDTKAILALLDQISSHRTELGLTPAQQANLEEASESVRNELAKPEPKPSKVSAGLKIIKEIATKVVESAAEKTITDNWEVWLSHLTTLMHRFAQMSF